MNRAPTRHCAVETIATLTLVASVAMGSAAQGPAQGDALTIRGVTVIDGRGSPPMPNATVTVEHGRITCVGPAGRCVQVAGARQIDGHGRWLMPGLFDAHAHLSENDHPATVRLLHLAFGVTSVRDLGGYADSLIAWRARTSRGDEAGTRIHLAGHPIDGDPPKWPAGNNVARIARTGDEARQLVRDARAGGSDFIKLYAGLTTAAVQAAVLEAHAQGLRVTADLLGWPVPRVDTAVSAGLDGLEHGLQLDELSFKPAGQPRDTVAVAALLSRMRSSGTVLTPTLVYIERAWSAAVPVSAATYRALPPGMQRESGDMLRPLNTWFESASLFTRMFAERGGIIMAGTDSYWRNVYPGDVHRELELLVQCGLTPSQALMAATSIPANWLRADSLGTIAAGKLADLVLLRGDPLADIHNTQHIELVVQGGKVWKPAELVAMARRASR